MQPFGKNGGGDGSDTDEPPFPVGVFDEFADDERRQNARGSHPVADFTFDGPRRVMAAPVLLFLLPLRLLSRAAHNRHSRESSPVTLAGGEGFGKRKTQGMVGCVISIYYQSTIGGR